MPPEDSDVEDISDNGLQDMEEVDLSGDDELVDGLDDIDFSDGEHENEDDYDTIDESKLIFQKHEGSVFSIDISKNDPPLVVTGGEDDKGYVWNFNNGDVLFECKGHKDSIVCCGFTNDSKYVMTADMGGTVIVYNTSDGKQVWDYECSDLEWCKWHTSVQVLFAGTSIGDVYMWKISNGDCRIYQTHGSKSTCGHIMPSGKEILVGYEDGSLKLWNLKEVTSIFHNKCEAEGAVLCLDSQKNGNLVAYGTENGYVKLLNSHTGKQIATFTVSVIPSDDKMDDGEAGNDEEFNTIESIAFSPCGSYIVGGSANGNFCIWDISTQRLRHECRNPVGLSKFIWNEIEPNYIIVACLDGAVRMWDPKNGELFKEYQGGNGANILDIILSTDGKYILTVGDDHNARIFEK